MPSGQTVRSACSEQIERTQRQEKIGDEGRRAGVILCHSLAEEERDDRDRGEGRTGEGENGIVLKNYRRAPNRAERSSCNLKDGDYGNHQSHHSRERTLGEMPLQPFEVAAAVHDLIDARLKEEDREERRGKGLEKI